MGGVVVGKGTALGGGKANMMGRRGVGGVVLSARESGNVERIETSVSACRAAGRGCGRGRRRAGGGGPAEHKCRGYCSMDGQVTRGKLDKVFGLS